MNLETLRLRVQSTVGLAGGTAGNEQTLIDGWYNEAVVQFLMETKAVKRTASLSLTGDESDYVLDDEVLAFEDVYLEPGDGSREFMLEPKDSHDIRQMRRSTTSVAAGPSFYAYEGQVVMLYPAPSTGDELHIVYVAKPTSAMAATGDDPADATHGRIPNQYHPVLEAYVKWKAAEYSNDGPSQIGQMYRSEWEQGLIKVRVIESRKGGLIAPRARVGGRRRHAVGPGVDLGY